MFDEVEGEVKDEGDIVVKLVGDVLVEILVEVEVSEFVVEEKFKLKCIWLCKKKIEVVEEDKVEVFVEIVEVV